jgi:WD40 repeat protein
MPLDVICPNCEKVLPGGEEGARQQIGCPRCGHPIPAADAGTPTTESFHHDPDATGSYVPKHDSALDQALPEVPGYAIERVLGRGGMGIVYQARHLALKRPVALKMILAGADAGEQERLRFRAEAEAIARLQHPNIVQVHEVGAHDGRPFFSLEFCAGGSLDRKVGSTPLPPLQAARLVETLARAMQAAHDANVVHRDLKPANVLLTADGTPKITDFGLAKKLDDVGQTQSGAVLGTPAYMAPEQAAGRTREVGPAADVYALGAILYKLLTGRPPFQGSTLMATLQQVLGDEPVPPGRLVPGGVPRDLATVCLKALRKDPRERYASARELADDLNRFLHDEPVRARQLGRMEQLYRWCRRHPTRAGLLAATAGLLALTAVTATLSVYHFRLQEAVAGEERQRDRAVDALRQAQRYLYFNRIYLADRAYHDNQIARGRQLLADCPAEMRGWEWRYLDRVLHAELFSAAGHRGAVQALAFPGHGNWLVSCGRDHNLCFWSAETGRLLSQVADHSGPVSSVAVRADGRRLASVAGTADQPGELLVRDVLDGEVPETRKRFTLPGAGDGAAVAYQPGGQALAVALGVCRGQPGGVLLLEDGKEPKRWPPSPGRGATALAWSPDGHFLAAAFNGPAAAGQVVVWDVGTGAVVKEFTPADGPVRALAYSGDAGTRRVVLATAGAGGFHLWDLPGYTPRAVPRQGVADVLALAFTSSGLLLTGCQDTTVRAWDVARGRETFARRGHVGPVCALALHPVTGRIYSGSEDARIHCWRPEQEQESEVYRLHAGAATGLAFSPDGKDLVSVGLDGAVWRLDPAGAAPPRKLRQEPGPLRQVRFLPAGRGVLSAGAGAVRILSPADGSVRAELDVGLATVRGLSLGRDGRRLALLGETAGGDTVVRMHDLGAGRPWATIPAAGAVLVVLFQHGSKLLVLFQRREQEPDERIVYDLADGEPRRLPHAPSQDPAPRCAALSADETALLTGGAHQIVHVWQVRRNGSINLAGNFFGHSGAIDAAAFSPNDRVVATASADGTVRLWELEGRVELLALPGDGSPFRDVAFHPGGDLLAAADAAGAVRLWRTSPRPVVGGDH